MADTYDVVVIGAGPAGYVSAIRASQLGLKVACVESESYEGGLGGTCLNWGCIPAKALLESAALAQAVKEKGESFGVKTENVQYDMDAAVQRSRDIAEKLSGGVGYLLKKNNIDSIIGRGRITKERKVAVEPVEAGGEARTLDTRAIVVATGSVMHTFPGFEIDGERVIGSREALDLRQLPSKMLVVGGGFVGVEFADVFNAFGVEVTIVEGLDSLVPLEDPEIGKALSRSFKKRKIDVRPGTMVRGLEDAGGALAVAVESKKGEERIETDLVLMAVGRKPVTSDIGLEDVGVELEDGFIKIDGHCQTNVEGIYAAGDVAGAPMLAHKGSHEGIVAAEAIAGAAPHPMRYDNIASVGYCHPEIATIGMTEEAAEQAGYEVVVGKYPLASHGRALTAGDNEGFVKLVADGKYGEVLGIHMIGHNVSELVSEVGLGRLLESTTEEIAAFAHPHPSMSEAVMQAAFVALGRPIDI